MRAFILGGGLLALAALIVASRFFHSRRADVVLARLRLAGWAYVALVLLMAGIQFWRGDW